MSNIVRAVVDLTTYKALSQTFGRRHTLPTALSEMLIPTSLL